MITTRLSALTMEDVPLLERVEAATGLSFWGRENYIRFLRDFPEYFGTKAMVFADSTRGRFAGFLLARSIFENLEILKVGVWPEFHRQGVGTLLMKAAYAEGIRRGCERCFLEVRKSNRGAIDFYFAHKFVLSGVRRNYYTEPVEDALIMERSFHWFGAAPRGEDGEAG
jgi:ribosomal-protein-alanine N-acetyltransferase